MAKDEFVFDPFFSDWSDQTGSCHQLPPREYLNSDKPAEEYKKIFNGKISEQKAVLKRCEHNMETREKQADDFTNAIFFSVLYGIG